MKREIRAIRGHHLNPVLFPAGLRDKWFKGTYHVYYIASNFNNFHYQLIVSFFFQSYYPTVQLKKKKREILKLYKQTSFRS